MPEQSKNKLPVLVFVAAFVLTTVAIVYLNSQFMNIFKFNFNRVNHRMLTPQQQIKENYSKYLDSLSRQIRAELMDSVKIYSLGLKDSLIANKDSLLYDSLNTMRVQLQKTSKEDSVAKVVKDFVDKTKDDSVYVKWTKKTAMLYESMDAKKAAKIIQNYSDNIARDIIYTMKKKKAAEILANLSPDQANRFTRIR